MKKLLFAIIFTLILPITVSADIEKEICDWSGGTIGCEGQSSFKEFKGYYKPPDPDLYVDPEGESIFKCYSLRECVLNYTNFFLGFLALAAVITIIYGGYLYVLAGGEAEKTYYALGQNAKPTGNEKAMEYFKKKHDKKKMEDF